MIYINGEVNKVGGIELGEHDSISVTQAITMVGGLARDAAPDKLFVPLPKHLVTNLSLFGETKRGCGG